MQDYAPDAAANAGVSLSHAGTWVLNMAAHDLPPHGALLAILAAAARSPHAAAPAGKTASGKRSPDGFQAERMAGHCASG